MGFKSRKSIADEKAFSDGIYALGLWLLTPPSIFEAHRFTCDAETFPRVPLHTGCRMQCIALYVLRYGNERDAVLARRALFGCLLPKNILWSRIFRLLPRPSF